MSKGWFRVPGVRPKGDRSIEEQMLGLGPALDECKGKTVLDLGCAEGALGREFVKAGAVDVLGIEALESHLDVALQYCKDFMPPMRFVCAKLEKYMPAHEPPEQFDIVLNLGVAHKVRDPNTVMRWACRSARDLVCFRGCAAYWDGWFEAKRGGVRCHVPTVMGEQGFAFEKKIAGARGEAVEYWRRQK